MILFLETIAIVSRNRIICDRNNNNALLLLRSQFLFVIQRVCHLQTIYNMPNAPVYNWEFNL